MKKNKFNIIFIGGFILTLILSNAGTFVRDGMALDNLRSSVLRLHILAESDSERDQNLKLKVRDEILKSGILDGAENLSDAENIAREKIPEIIRISEKTLQENGCNLPVSAEITDMHFDERVYGNITMPAGDYKALRIKIGSAHGHNWWCVMYPPLCLPAACEVKENPETTAVFFNEKENDIMKKPEKYRVRFALWDKLKEILR
ncbi:MAG: stage II sporulation protein R [Prevotella sp.]|nr:stage II sporulation protein R [Alistipes senegalensis]MCM1358542.1 stage II sporulation protein R [Prevotella sp.]MCM1473966.1 stage II sporulation protein R [Muribaculaceae bacterium]